MTPSAKPTIAPLARRLAEENNVDWRALKGSSAGGAVNERDILDYLEAVMLGQKPLDPTPEPLPAGMSAWPEEAARPAQAEPPGNLPWSTAAPPPPAPAPAARSAAPVQTFEAEYRAARAEADGLRAKVAGLETDLLELAPLRDLVKGQNEALAKAKALEPQLAELRAALAGAQAETRKAQEHGFDLAARLAKVSDAQTKAEAEAKRLREANAGLEEAVAKLRSRPWWKFWG